VLPLSREHALDAHHAKKLPKSTLHDWRHTHTILMRGRGTADHLIARQLEHWDTVLIATRYGRFTPDTSEVRAAAGGEVALAASS
jgi:integrase